MVSSAFGAEGALPFSLWIGALATVWMQTLPHSLKSFIFCSPGA